MRNWKAVFLEISAVFRLVRHNWQIIIFLSTDHEGVYSIYLSKYSFLLYENIRIHVLYKRRNQVFKIISFTASAPTSTFRLQTS